MTGIVTSERAKSAEKLASGYKINRAADNAASLTISEKMRKQMRGLDRASTNGKDGISLCQTADGALHEVHEMLQRCNELAIQAANGTLAPADRQAINNEIAQLKREINCISTRTKFNQTLIFPSHGYLPRVDSVKTNTAATDAAKELATKIANEYFPNAVEQILNTFEPLGFGIGHMAAVDKTQFNTKLDVKVIDGVNNKLASMSAGFTLPDQRFVSGTMLLEVDKEDFPSVNLSSDQLQKLESTLAHEVMHGVMYAVFPNRMYTTSTKEDFPKWYIEGTAQLAGGGYTTGWNNSLTNIASSLSSADDSSKDYEISRYLSRGGDYTVDKRVYGHGYLAAAYASYLAADSNDVSQSTLINGTNNLFNAFYNSPDLPFDSILKAHTGLSEELLKQQINSGSTTSLIDGKVSPTEFVRRLTYLSLGGAGSLITPSLKTGGTQILGDTAVKSEQPLEIMTTETETVTFDPVDNTGHGASLALHVGSETDMTNKIEIQLFSINTDALNLKETNLLTADNATSAINDFADAIMMISGIRSYYGAIQNRVEHTILNLDSTVENTTASESRIRDTDFADEMVRLSSLNILQNAGQAMLAQANQTPQGVMALLQ